MNNRRSKISTADIIKCFIGVHGNKYSYEKVTYKTMHDKIIINCPIHGDFEMLPKQHEKRGDGCRQCAYIKQAETQKDTTCSFIEKSKSIFKNRYSYINTTYDKNAHIPIIITCKIHGDFKITPNSHLSKHCGCIKCGNITSKRKLINNNILGWGIEKWIERCKGKNATLYILRCYNTTENFIKIGITSKGIKKRFSGKIKMPYSYEILKEIKGEAREVYLLEAEYKKSFKKFKYIPSTKFAGSKTECFEYDKVLLKSCAK